MLIEAGHRCAIPACRQVPVEIAHIVPWAKCRDHTLENLIALCPTCHTRFDKGEIDRKSMVAYKHALILRNSRYGDLEQRVLRLCVRNKTDEVWLLADLEILVLYLLEDGLLEDTGQSKPVGAAGAPLQKLYKLTTKGKEYIARWLTD